MTRDRPRAPPYRRRCRSLARAAPARDRHKRTFRHRPMVGQILRRETGPAWHQRPRPGWAVRRHRRPQRLRQEHAAAPPPQPRPTQRRRILVWRPRGAEARTAGRAGHVPGAAVAALGERARQCGGRARRGAQVPRCARARAGGVARSRLGRPARRMALGALRGAETTRGPGPRAGQPAAGAGVRRTAGRARCVDPYFDAAAARAGLARSSVSPRSW